MSLSQWLDNAWVRKVQRSAGHVNDLLAIAGRQLGDASLSGISTDGKFNHAYDAIRTLCEIALHAEGFIVPKGVRQHERTIESLKFTIGGDWVREVDFFDRCRRLRNESIYDRSGRLQLKDAEDLLARATDLHSAILDWLTRCHSDLLSKS